MQYINLSLKPSWQLLVFFSGLYLLVMAAIFLSMAPFWLQAITASLVIIHAAYVLKTKILLKGSKSITAINAQEKHLWQLGFNNEEVQQADLCGHSFISRIAMILNFTCPASRKKFSVLLVPSMSGKESFRQLLVYCRVRH